MGIQGYTCPKLCLACFCFPSHKKKKKAPQQNNIKQKQASVLVLLGHCPAFPTHSMRSNHFACTDYRLHSAVFTQGLHSLSKRSYLYIFVVKNIIPQFNSLSLNEENNISNIEMVYSQKSY